MENKIIEEAAKDYADLNVTKFPDSRDFESGLYIGGQDGFIAGAKWSLNNQWVNINVNLPIDCEPVLGIKDGFYPLVVRYDSSERCFKSVEWNEVDIDYWMPIPLLTLYSNDDEI